MENLVPIRGCKILNKIYRLSYNHLNAFGGNFLFLVLVCLKLTSVAAFFILETDVYSQIITADSVNATAIEISWRTQRAHRNPRDFNVEIDPPDGQIIGNYDEHKATAIGLVPDRTYQIYLSFRTTLMYIQFPEETAKLFRLDVRTKSAPDSRLYIIPDNTRDSYTIHWSLNTSQINFDLMVHNLNTSHIDGPAPLGQTTRLDSLAPSTTYNLTISNGVQSDWAILTTRPEMPEQLRVQQFGRNGFNLSWSSGAEWPKSEQRSYLVRLLNRRTRRAEDYPAKDTEFSITDLRPGDGFVVQVSTRDGDQLSRPAIASYVVQPLSPTNMQIDSQYSTEQIILNWDQPEDSTYDGFIGLYRLRAEPDQWHRFRTFDSDMCGEDEKGWVQGLVPGEQYVLRAISTSLGRNSTPPYPEVLHTVLPRSVIQVMAKFEETLLTLYWNRTVGHAELIRVRLYHKEEEVYIDHFAVDEVCFENPPVNDFNASCWFDFEKRYVIPGIEYRAVLDAFANGVYSADLASVTGYTRPAINEQFVVALDRTNHTRVIASYGTNQHGAYDGYRFVCREVNTTIRTEKRIERLDWHHEVVFDGLKPATLYEFGMQTTSDGHYSLMTAYTLHTYPAPVQNLTIVSSNPTGVTIRWDYANITGADVDFSVRYQGKNSSNISVFVRQRGYHIDQLLPGQHSMVLVVARVNHMLSFPSELTVRAGYGQPAQIQEVTVTATGVNMVLVRWQLANESADGSLGIDEFVVQQRNDHLDAKVSHQRSVQAISRSCTFVEIRADRRYYFQVMARLQGNVMSRWKGVWLDMPRMRMKSRLAKPGKTPMLTDVEATTANVVMRRVALNDKNDNNEYFVIVFMAGKFNYIAMQLSNPFRNIDSDVIDVSLGTEDCRVEAGALCNGPLRPGIDYSVMIRVRTNDRLLTETHTSTSIRPVSGDWALSTIGAILFSVLLAITVSCLCASLMRPDPPERAPLVNELPDLIPEDLQNCRTPRICETPFHRRRRVELLVAEMLHPAAGPDLIQDYCYHTYHMLRHEGAGQAAKVGNLPPNWQFNRFYNIVPYDRSRVVLEATGDFRREGYINANYISGENLNREFIATQCPTELTIEAFWRMVWQKGVRAIVALVPLDEDQNLYWPLGRRTVECGPFTINHMRKGKIERGIYSVKLLCLQLGGKRRYIFHMHYGNWKDHELPESEEALAELWVHFRQLVPAPQRGRDGDECAAPVVVHCRAGIGQTGAFIALDRCMRCVELGAESLDLCQIVQDLRYGRTAMVDELVYEMVLRVVRLVIKLQGYFALRQQSLTEQFMKPEIPRFAIVLGPPRIYHAVITDNGPPAVVVVPANRAFPAQV